MRVRLSVFALAIIASGTFAWAASPNGRMHDDGSSPSPSAAALTTATAPVPTAPVTIAPNLDDDDSIPITPIPRNAASSMPDDLLPPNTPHGYKRHHRGTSTASPEVTATTTPFVQPSVIPPSSDSSDLAPDIEPRHMLSATPAAGYADLQSHPIIHRKILVNGLQVVVVEDHAAPVMQTGMWYRFGALDEVPGKTGLAHGLEHMMFRGTPSLSEGGFDDVMAHEGAEANANTANDYTHFYLVMPASRLELALHIEADRMRNLLLNNEDWQLEKGAVLSEYDGDLGNPTTALYNDVCLEATPVPLCGLGALGIRSDIVRSKASDLRAYYDRFYRPNNATLVVVGDVDAEHVFAVAARAFEPIASKPVHRLSHLAPTLAQNKRIVEHGDSPYATIDIAYPSVGDLNPNAGVAAVLDGVLSNPRTPLYDSLVVKGLALGYETSLASNLAGGLQHVIITVAPGHSAKQVEHAFQKTLAFMLQNGISDSYVNAAKRAALVNSISSRDAINSLGDRIGYALGVEQRNPSVDDQLIANVTTTDVNDFARQTLIEPSVVGILLPQRPKPGADSGSVGKVADNFSGRAPSGPIVKAPWVKKLLLEPLQISSRIHPTEFHLSNGLHVLVQPIHENPTVFIEGQIEGSPKLEPAGKTGLRDMTSQLLGYGGDRYDFDAQHRLADELGASLSFGEVFSAHGLAHDLPTLLDALADGELHPSFPAKYVSLVRSQTIAEIDARDRDPDSLASRKLSLLLLPVDDPELRQATRASIARIKRTDFYAYAERAFRPDLTTITVVGDVTPEQVRYELERTFGDWEATGPRPKIGQKPLPLPLAQYAHVLATRRLVQVELAQPSVARNSKDFIALNLINAMLGGGGAFDTRLMSQLRERRGLVYSASSGLQVGKYRGMLVMNLSTEPKHVRQAISLARAELRSFLAHAPTYNELQRARERLVAGSLVAEQSTATITAHVATIGHFGLPSTYYQHLWQTYEKITPADILAVARRQLHPDHLVVVTEGPSLPH